MWESLWMFSGKKADAEEVGIMGAAMIVIVVVVVVISFALYVIVPASDAKDANESELKIKTIKHDNKPSGEESAVSVADFSLRSHKYSDAKIKHAKVNSGKITMEVDSSIRASGGITAELFCKDNIGHYMPIWGGSITKETSEWIFTKQDIHRQNIDGCYFAVVDSTAEMEAMTS